MKDQKYPQFTGEFLTSEDCKKRGMNAPFGDGLTKRAYQLNVSAFLNASKQYLMNNDSWESNKFDLEEYNDEQKIIFCEGFRSDNPLFNHLPFAPARAVNSANKDSNKDTYEQWIVVLTRWSGLCTYWLNLGS